MKFILPIIVGYFLSLTVHSQDIHYSQVMNCPLNQNPSFTGDFDGDWRFIGNYRNQWRSLDYPFRTLSCSFDKQVYIKNHHLSLGGFIVNDHSGDVALNTNKVYASGAYHRVLNNHQLSVGLQVGFVLKQVDSKNLTFPSGWDQSAEEYLTSIGIKDDLLNYIDVNAGFNWKKKIRSFEPQVGIAFYHLNGPKESFNYANNHLPIRSSIYIGVKVKLSQNFYFKPEFSMSSLRGAKDIIVGTEAGYAMSGNTFNIREVRAGVYARNTFTNTVDAMVLTLGAQVRKLYFQISYDYNVSALNKLTNSRGAFELTFIYKSISTIIKTFTIPCERI